MDVGEQRYRKVMSEFRGIFSNIIGESPLGFSRGLSDSSRPRNLKYISNKALVSANYPYYNPIYQQALEEIKTSLGDQDPESRALAIRLARSLPFLFRIRLIETCENDLTSAMLAQQKREGSVSLNPYGYEVASDLSELLLSVFELTTQSEEIYFDVNQRIISIFSRFFQSTIIPDKNILRNCCEVLRAIFWTFGPKQEYSQAENKLIAKLLAMFVPPSSFVNRQEASLLNPNQIGNSYNEKVRNNTKLFNLVLRCRQFEARVRARLLYGFCCLITYLPMRDCELLDLLAGELFIILENIPECDVALDCSAALSVLAVQDQEPERRSQTVRRWFAAMAELSYKKQYLQSEVLLLQIGDKGLLPMRLRYSIALHSLELTRHIQQQFSRFVIYVRACKSILQVASEAYRHNPQANFLLGIFQHGWFIDRINAENDLFKSQFLIGLLHAAADKKGGKQQIADLVDLCHRLIDWKCTSKEETHIPTLKFAFDMYLHFLKWACSQLGDGVQPYIIQLINRCNQPSIYFLFKFKLIAALLSLPWYQQNYKYLQQAQLNFKFLQDEVRLVMMPKNPKPIFTFEYSLTYDGEIESRKEIEYIKIIMNLLTQIQKVHQNHLQEVAAIFVDYHKYLNDLELKEDSNKQLVNCLQALEADSYFSDCQRYFLLALVENGLRVRSLNSETNLQDLLLYSHHETIDFEEQVNIFGPMSPVQLTVRLHPAASYHTVYIHVKKNQWVQTQADLKLIISSGLEKKEVPFQSSILEIKVDRVGCLHFQVWKGTENQVLLGSGNYRIRRKLQWRRVKHLQIIDGIKTKAYFKEWEPGSADESFLSYYYGEPILVHILKSQNQVVFAVSNKEVWNEIRDIASILIQQLTNGSAQILSDDTSSES